MRSSELKDEILESLFQSVSKRLHCVTNVTTVIHTIFLKKSRFKIIVYVIIVHISSDIFTLFTFASGIENVVEGLTGIFC